MSAFLIRRVVSSAFLCKYSVSFSFTEHNSPHICTIIGCLFCLFHWRISKIDLLWRKSAPEHWGHMCVVAAAAASWLALLAAPCLHPVVCQTAKQGKRWDKWLFMICHIPSSQLSPGPIYYSCRLPLCGKKTCTHTQMLNTVTFAHMHCAQANTQTVFFQYLVLSKAAHLRHSLLSCHRFSCTNRSRNSTLQTSPHQHAVL